MRLTALEENAERLGLKRGQGVAEARAIHPMLDVVEADEQADMRFLEGIADWCDRYTPLVAIDGSDGLFLDITGCAHLFGGEKALLADVLSRLFHLGLDVRGAISSSPGLSWASARFGNQEIVTEGDGERILSSLPLPALRLDGVLIASLLKVGLKRVGDILEAPRAPLARRFGPQLLLRLDQALGMEDEPISPRRPVASLSAERRLAEPVQSEEDLLSLADLLATSLKPALEARGLGGRLFELLLFRVDGQVFRIAAGATASLRNPKKIAALFAERFHALHDDLDAGFGFEILRLNVLQTESFAEGQADFTRPVDDVAALATFVDQAVARFGTQNVLAALQFESHMPERASRLVPATQAILLSRSSPLHASVFRGQRPIRLFRYPECVDVVAEVPEGPPANFRWRRTLHRVIGAEGPERLAAEWWIDGEDALTRDYFRIEDEAGRRYWLYREGLYEREARAPRWFMHGVFA